MKLNICQRKTEFHTHTLNFIKIDLIHANQKK